MAHNIHFNEQTQQHSFFSVKQKAWHNLGQIVEHAPTSAEAIKLAGLDYTVTKKAIFTDDFVNVENHFATVRTDTGKPLGVVGKKYEVVQNVDAFTFFDSILGGEKGIHYETAGALGNGEKIFITAKLPDTITVGKSDLIEQYLFLTTSHDGSGSITAAFTPIRIVCNNTLNAALRSHSNAVNIRHTANAKEQLAQAHKIMGISYQAASDLEQLFNQWAKTPVTDAQVKKLAALALAPNKEVFEAIVTKNSSFEFSSQYKNMVLACEEYAHTSPTQMLDTTRGTLYGAYNAVTGYFQNVKQYQSDEAKLNSLLTGHVKDKAQTAFNLCLDYAQYLN